MSITWRAAQGDRLVPVRSPPGALLGWTGNGRISDGAPLRLLWAHAGHLYLGAPFRDRGHCFIAVEPSAGSRSVCGSDGSLQVRRIAGERHRWFAFTPAWARVLRVVRRSVPARDGVALFTAGRRPAAVVAIGGGRSLRLRVP